jgi:hypothetical protein
MPSGGNRARRPVSSSMLLGVGQQMTDQHHDLPSVRLVDVAGLNHQAAQTR